jgi:protein TonB
MQLAVVCAAMLMALRAAPCQADAETAENAPASLMSQIDVSYDLDNKTASYAPKLDPSADSAFKIYPVITVTREGKRKIDLRVVIMGPPKQQPNSLAATLDGEKWAIPISWPADVDASGAGCLDSLTILLMNQEAFVRAVARASSAEISVGGYPLSFRRTLDSEVQRQFKTMVSLWELPTLPSTWESALFPAPNDSPYHLPMSGLTEPELIHKSRVSPTIPDVALRRGATGRVVLVGVVHADGSIGELRVLQPAGGNCGFEAAAIDAVRQWRFKPATKDGTPVAVYFTLVIEFKTDSHGMRLRTSAPH